MVGTFQVDREKYWILLKSGREVIEYPAQHIPAAPKKEAASNGLRSYNRPEVNEHAALQGCGPNSLGEDREACAIIASRNSTSGEDDLELGRNDDPALLRQYRRKERRGKRRGSVERASQTCACYIISAPKDGSSALTGIKKTRRATKSSTGPG